LKEEKITVEKLPKKSRRPASSGAKKARGKKSFDVEAGRPVRSSLVEFFRNSPLVGVKIDLERDRSPARDVDLFSKD
jgi:hypothetical protein